jgi:hypothetical protein
LVQARLRTVLVEAGAVGEASALDVAAVRKAYYARFQVSLLQDLGANTGIMDILWGMHGVR